MAVVFENRLIRVVTDPVSPIVHVTRTAEHYADLAELERINAEVGAVLDGLGRRGLGLLMDLRLAKPANTPGFEEAMARGRQHLLHTFPRVAVLVKTAAGALQVQRHGREDGLGLRVFHDDPEAALRFLREGARAGGVPSSRR